MKRLACLVCCVLLLTASLPALAEMPSGAEELTTCLTLDGGKGAKKLENMLDGTPRTRYASSRQKDPSLVIRCDTPIHALYWQWGIVPESWAIQKVAGDGWETVASGESGFAHEYAEVPGLTELRLVRVTNGKRQVLDISELRAFGEGEVPADIQRWQPTPQKADMLVFVAHPDDEYVFMGGLLPTYAGQRGYHVVVAYLTTSNVERRSELLNGLWHAGVREYPVMGDFSDKYSSKLPDAYKYAGGERDAKRFAVNLLRTYRPEVVVSHDVGGEYGHGMHKLCADLMRYAVPKANDPEYMPKGVEPSLWEIKKLYLHLWGENQIMLDWESPLPAFGGKTALSVGEECYRLHVSQYGDNARAKVNGKWYVFGVNSHDEYDNALFGLVSSTVGLDEKKDDLMENVAEN